MENYFSFQSNQGCHSTIKQKNWVLYPIEYARHESSLFKKPIVLSMNAEQLAYRWRLFSTLTWTNFKLRYYGSYLGYFWSLLKPLGLFGVLYIVFTVFLKQSTPHFGVALLLGIIVNSQNRAKLTHFLVCASAYPSPP